MKKKKVALVLSSGGARGLAHIGVIEELLSQGYEISSVAGSSMGAMIGGFYAAGELEKYKNWVTKLDAFDVFKLMDFSLNLKGFVKGDRVLNEIQKIIPDRNIEDLAIPYTATAVNLKNKKEVIFKKGSLFKAIRASISIPMVFSPVYHNDMLLVDGGILNPIPMEHVYRQGNELTVVVNVNANIKPENNLKKTKKDEDFLSLWTSKIQSLFSEFPKAQQEDDDELGMYDLINNTIDAMLFRISSLILENHPPDLLIEISQQEADTFDFYKADELIRLGRKKAAKVLKKASGLSSQ